MLIIFDNNPEFGEIAHAKYEERKRIISLAHLIISKFPEQFSSRRKNKIATEVCSILYKEIEEKFNLL